ncbi:hypothetical protein BRD13_07350 [Halobacteriales archaeon SW_5_70_135]|nr:MAG: hypothetical protein BRD13_07350 [Halobacteriales archaeon SW_5_70_135]
MSVRFASTATADGPATVTATLTDGNPFENTFELEWTPPFGRRTSDLPHPMGDRFGDTGSYRVRLAFAPTANHDLVDDPPAVERAADGYWRLAGGVDHWLPERVRLGPGETVHGEYALVGRADGVGRGRPQGVYEFARPDERPLRVTVWETDAPGSEPASRFEGVSLPSLSGENGIAWYHEADTSTPTFVRPSVERTDLPARIEFTFLNRAREPTSCGHWSLYKLHDGDWYRLGPYVRAGDCRVVGPGGWKTWTLRAANGELAPSGAADYGHLGGGRYAAVAGYGHATAESAALVEFDAGPVAVVPTEDATGEREDDMVTVTSGRWRAAPDEEGRARRRLVLERVDRADRTLIAEQVMRRRFRGLRNTLAFAVTADAIADVDRVVLRADDAVVDRVLGYDADRRRVRFDGRAYALRRASADD